MTYSVSDSGQGGFDATSPPPARCAVPNQVPIVACPVVAADGGHPCASVFICGFLFEIALDDAVDLW
ncbi:MAG: hypothetical protein ACE149_16280 [Armatimonadota bacterium]